MATRVPALIQLSDPRVAAQLVYIIIYYQYNCHLLVSVPSRPRDRRNESSLDVDSRHKEKSVGEETRENSSTDNKDGKRIRPGAQMIATHDYKKNPESPVGNELDVNEGDTLVYLMTNENNEHWWLAEDGRGQVGYVPATYLKIIRDVTRQEEESDTAGKEGYGKKTDGSKIGGDMGQDGERRKDVFSGSDRGIQEELGDLCGILYS